MTLKVKGQERYVDFVSDYLDKTLTTGGLYSKDELEEVTEPVIGITYCSEMCSELPVDWRDMLWLDDNNKRQHIKDILFEEVPAYKMEDGYISQEVTG